MLGDSPLAEQPVYQPEIVPSHLNARTKKRFRDNRPAETEIHGTYLLFWICAFPPATLEFPFVDTTFD